METVTSVNTAAVTTGTETVRRPYLPMDLGRNIHGMPTAFHMEGYISAPPYFRDADNAITPFLSVNMGVSRVDSFIMAVANGSFEKGKLYEGQEFIRVLFRGALAERMHDVLDTGMRIAVTGSLCWNSFERRDGSTGRQLIVQAIGATVLGNRSHPAEMNPDIVTATKIYTDRNCVERTMPMACLVTVTVRQNWGLRTAASGRSYLSLAVEAPKPGEEIYALTRGNWKEDYDYGNNRDMRMVVFERQAIALAELIKPGDRLLVTGSIKRDEFNGQVHWQMSPRCLTLMRTAEAETTEKTAAATADPDATSPAVSEKDSTILMPISAECTLPF